MALETSDEDFDLLRRRCDELNLFVQRHKQWDPIRGTGDLYLMPKRKFREEHCDSILRYATAEQIWDYIKKMEKRYA